MTVIEQHICENDKVIQQTLLGDKTTLLGKKEHQQSA
jgi:hypothetical protein